MTTPTPPVPARRPGLVALALLLVAGLAPSAPATERFTGEAEAVIQGEAAAPWEAVERHRDPHPRFPDEPFHPKLTHSFPPVRDAFGTATPHSSQFLLHRAPGWDTAPRATPVLLLPGANDDGTRRYARPLSTRHPDFAATPGLMQYLAGRGYPVFALSFSHYHGDNRYQGEHVANAITRIRQLLGAGGDLRVDLVTYSKGAMAARCYLEDAGQGYPETRFLTPYRGDVRRVVFQAGPLAGVDMPFRYYLYNLSLATRDVPAPLGASHLLTWGSWSPTGWGDIHSGVWPGQLQMLHDLRTMGIPHGPLSLTADGNFTAHALLEGGRSLFLASRGLEAAVEAGGQMIERLNARGLPPGVEASLLAGTDPVLEDETYPTLSLPIGGQWVAPNDGLVFVRSALHAEGLTARGATIRDRATLPYDHLDLSRAERAYAWVEAQLR